jgi:hypothetical protein
VASFKSSGHPEGLGRFKVRRAAGDTDILQAPVVEAFQFATRPNHSQSITCRLISLQRKPLWVSTVRFLRSQLIVFMALSIPYTV